MQSECYDMRYLSLLLTLLFLISGSVHAEGKNVWVLLWMDTINWKEDPKTYAHQTFSDYRSQTYQSKVECYEGLKKTALREKKINDNDFIKRMTIELVDDVRVTASAKSDFLSVQIICVEIEILD